MRDRLGSRRARLTGFSVTALAGVALVALVVVTGALAGGARSTACGTVNLNENAWAGSTSNVYVVKYVLEKKVGCKVKVTDITEGQPNFQAMADGKIDAVLRTGRTSPRSRSTRRTARSSTWAATASRA